MQNHIHHNPRRWLRVLAGVLALLAFTGCAQRHIWQDVSVVDPCPVEQIMGTCTEALTKPEPAAVYYNNTVCVCVCPPGWACDWLEDVR